ncbi:hypothetical protein M5689_018528 [Euphorbia peplus]|nr:hypothetical protein M5689_018528 [Euphorbia peplus]
MNTWVELVIKVLGSLFLFSLLLLISSSSLLPFIINFIHLFISNFSKSYIFLLCNGILVFVVKNSGGSHEETVIKIGATTSQNLEFQFSAETKGHVAEEKEVVVTEITKQVDEMEDELMIMVEEEEEEEEEEEMSKEELNKKCEDFIRMMKFNIQLEAQHLRFL